MNYRLVAYWQACYFAATCGFTRHEVIGMIVWDNLDPTSGSIMLVNWKGEKHTILDFVSDVLTKEMPHMLKVKP